MTQRSLQPTTSPAPQGRTLFVTGATGFVGAALALELLRNCRADRAFCIARADDDDAAQGRITRALTDAARAYDVSDEELASVLDRAFGVRGDICEPGLGLSEAGNQRLSEAGPLTVWHCAASLKDSEKALSEIVAHNVAGTETILRAVLAFEVAVFNHVSTAYVAGRTTGEVSESMDRPRGFNNRYEQSKHYGEHLVVDHCTRAGVPYRILRPSIVISHSVTGRATGYTGYLGWILKVAYLHQTSAGALSKNSLRYVAEAETQLNVIPIDSVVEDCVGIDAAGQATHNQVFHLTNSSPPTVRWLCDVTTNTLGIQPVELVDDGEDLDPVSQKLYRWTRFERPYSRGCKRFSRAASNQLYASPRHGNCPLSEEVMKRMIFSAVVDYMQRAQKGAKGAA